MTMIIQLLSISGAPIIKYITYVNKSPIKSTIIHKEINQIERIISKYKFHPLDTISVKNSIQNIRKHI